MFLKTVAFLYVLVATYCINAKPDQPEKDYESTVLEKVIVMEALDEVEREGVKDYTDFVKESGLIEEKEIQPVTGADNNECKATLAETNSDVSEIIAAKNALELACSLTTDPETRCTYFISVYQQTHRTYDYACFYNSENYYVNPKAKFVKFNLGTGNYFLFNQRRY